MNVFFSSMKTALSINLFCNHPLGVFPGLGLVVYLVVSPFDNTVRVEASPARSPLGITAFPLSFGLSLVVTPGPALLNRVAITQPKIAYEAV